MKKVEGNSLKKILVYAVLLIVIVTLGFATKLINMDEMSSMFSVSGASLLKLAVMIFGVLLLENVIVVILGLFKPKSHRARSIVSLSSSMVKYVAFIVGFSAESLIADVVTGTFMHYSWKK